MNGSPDDYSKFERVPEPAAHDDYSKFERVPEMGKSAAAPTGPPSVAADVAADVAKSGGVGAGRGVIGALGMAGDARDAIGNASEYALQRLAKWSGVAPESTQPQSYADIAAGNRKLADAVQLPGSADITRAVEAGTGKFYEPQTTAGRYAETIGEFAPSAAIGGGGLLRKAAETVIPAVASEGAGELTKGTAAEPYARAAAGVATGGGVTGAARLAAPTVDEMIARAAGHLTPAQVATAQGIKDASTGRGMFLSGPEAIQAATQGATKLGDVQRATEATTAGGGTLASLYAQRPAEVQAAVRAELDRIAPASANPSGIGPRAQVAAQGAVDTSPEGRTLADAVFRAADPHTPGQAGQVIQSQLSNLYDRREGMRNAIANRDYDAARNAAPNYDVHDFDPTAVQPRLPTVFRPTEEGYAPPARPDDGAPAPAPTPPAIAAPNDSGLVQTDPREFAGYLTEQQATAKGATRTALAKVGRMLNSGGGLDTSVAGLTAVRGQMGSMIEAATRSGDGPTARALGVARDRLDEVLSDVPEHATANANFQENSRPLAPFQNPAIARTIERNDLGTTHVMPPENVPSAIFGGGRPALDAFRAVAPPEARHALENDLATRVLQGAQDGTGRVNADSLSQRIQAEGDAFGAFPHVRRGLQNVVTADQKMAGQRTSLVGRVAGLPDGAGATTPLTQRVGDTLLPRDPLAGSEAEVADAAARLHAQAPGVSDDVIRQHLADKMDGSAVDLAGGPNQGQGVKFRNLVAGSPQQRTNLVAALGGPQRAQGLSELLDTLQAQSYRKAAGSNTAMDLGSREAMAQPSGLMRAGAAALNPLAAATHGFGEILSQHAADRNSAALAHLFAAPDSVAQIAALSVAHQHSALADLFARGALQAPAETRSR